MKQITSIILGIVTIIISALYFLLIYPYTILWTAAFSVALGMGIILIFICGSGRAWLNN